ncbi:MAG: AAA family ATPase [Saprospiraceae bacterium]
MLNSIQIENFRLFEKLNIEGLKRINLIAGMNNSGKTALLEALRIWAADGDNTVINAIQFHRGDFVASWQESFYSLFYLEDLSQSIKINDLTIAAQSDNRARVEKIIASCETRGKQFAHEFNANVSKDFPKDGCVFVPFLSQSFQFEELWKNIALTDDYDNILDVLSQADPRIKGVDIRHDGIKVRLTGQRKPASIGRLGDGILQTLKIAIGLVSAKDKKSHLLLIDEIESGLHHSVQLLVWEKVFHYAAEWDVQVFATTHSQDAVRTFAEVAGRPENEGQGCYFRLERDENEQVKAVVYDLQQLKTSIEYDLETR